MCFTRYRTWFNVLFLTSLVIVIKFFLGHVFILLGRLLRSDLLGMEHGSTFCFSHHSSSSIRFCLGHVFILLGRLLRLHLLGLKKNSLVHRLNFEIKRNAIAHVLFCNVRIYDL